MKIRHLVALVLILVCTNVWAQVVDPEPGRMTADGPYIIYNQDGSVRVLSVDVDGNVTDTVGTAPKSFPVVSHDGKYRFEVSLREHKRQDWLLEKTARTYVISDPHGRLDCLVSILQAGGVIDQNLDWSFGSDRLVVIGDVMDRGDDVTQIYWLLYKLQGEAQKAGGSLVMMYGNHESMVLADDLRYCREKYKTLSEKVGLTVPQLYWNNTELGQWIEEFNTMVKIGDDLFVHAGVSPDLVQMGLDIPTINAMCSEGLFMTSKQRKAHGETTYALFKTLGPVWYRGYFDHNKKYGPRMNVSLVSEMLEYFNAGRVLVGHTIFRNIRTFYDGRVVAIDVDAKVNYEAGRGRALLMDPSGEYVVKDSGDRKKL